MISELLLGYIATAKVGRIYMTEPQREIARKTYKVRYNLRNLSLVTTKRIRYGRKEITSEFVLTGVLRVFI